MNARILVIDDEPSICDILRSAFTRAGASVATAETARDALHMIAAEGKAFDLLLVDKNLPGGMNGVELIRQVRSADDEVSIIMITGYASAESIVETLNLGIDAYVEKPFPSISELVTLADSIMARKPVLAKIPVPTERTLDVLVAIRAGRTERSDLSGVFARVTSRVTFVNSDGELLSKLHPEPDLVVFDADLWEAGKPAVVRMLRGMVPDTTCVVFSDGTLSTQSLKQLIELGVSGLWDWNVDPDWRRKLETLARKILAS